MGSLVVRASPRSRRASSMPLWPGTSQSRSTRSGSSSWMRSSACGRSRPRSPAARPARGQGDEFLIAGSSSTTGVGEHGRAIVSGILRSGVTGCYSPGFSGRPRRSARGPFRGKMAPCPLPKHAMDRNTPRPTESSCTKVAHPRDRVRRRQALQPEPRVPRVFSPSAEVRGHGPGQEVLQVGKRDVESRRSSRWATTP